MMSELLGYYRAGGHYLISSEQIGAAIDQQLGDINEVFAAHMHQHSHAPLAHTITSN